MKNLLLIISLAFFAVSCASVTKHSSDTTDDSNKIERIEFLELGNR